MNVEKAIEQVSHYKAGNFPEEAVFYINENQDLFETKFIEILKSYNDDPRLFDEDKDDYVSALYSLALYRSKPAFPVILELLLKIPPNEEGDDRLGDLLTEDVPYILAACYDGNLDQIKKLILSTETFVFSRFSVFTMLTICLVLDRVKIEDVLLFYQDIMPKVYLQDKEDELIFYAMEELLTISLDVHDKLNKDVIIPFPDLWDRDDEYIRKQSTEGPYYIRNCGRLEDHSKKLEAIGLLITKKYAMFKEEDFRDDYDHLFENLQETYERLLPKIGRNDPSLCGSGKKYKKCCLE